jgi:hypothetical protein
MYFFSVRDMVLRVVSVKKRSLRIEGEYVRSSELYSPNTKILLSFTLYAFMKKLHTSLIFPERLAAL